ncbi:MAG: hypothetical protein ABI693_13635 [Bryobacteraceae bacterium]
MITTFVMTLTMAQTVLGHGSALVPVNLLVKNADAVVIGKILDGTVTAAQIATVHLKVQEVLKGDIRTGDVLTFDYRLRGDVARYTTSIEKDRGLFFLKSASGAWLLVPVTSGSILEFRGTFFGLPPQPIATRFRNPAEVSIHMRILAEVAGAMESVGTQRGGAIDFASEYRSNPSHAMKALFIQFKESKNPLLRAEGLRGAVSSGDERTLAEVEQGPKSLSATEVAMIAEEIQYYVKSSDARSVARLGRIAVSQAAPGQLREASLTALARIHTRECLPYLAAFLDDPDLGRRSLAVGGMAMFANHVPLGEHEPSAGPWKYRTADTLRFSGMDPASVQNMPGTVAFWKSWWPEHRQELQ